MQVTIFLIYGYRRTIKLTINLICLTLLIGSGILHDMRLYVIGTKNVIDDTEVKRCRKDIIELDYTKPDEENELLNYEMTYLSPF
jgi:hypothetical protein